MFAKRIAGATHNFGAPKGWDPAKDGDCHHLAVRAIQLPSGGLAFESAWELTPHELEQLGAGGQIVLRILGGQPPVALYVEPPQED